MRILGVDTATWRASVGLVVDGAIVAEQALQTTGNHAVSLLPLIDDVLQRAGTSVDALDAIAVSNGPGSFTGLRIGLSVAKGIARATGAQLVAVPTLEALAHTVDDHEGAICAVLDARKGELYAAVFMRGPAGLTRLTDDALLTLEALLAVLPTPCVILGDAVERYGALLHDHRGAAVTLLPFATHAPRGGVVARLGWERQGDRQAHLPLLEPSYVRPSEAETKALRS